MKVLAVIHGIIISRLPHREPSTKCQTAGIQTHHLFKVSCCLLPYCCHFNKFNKVPVYICKDATSETKANSKADVPNEENMAGKGGIIQLVLGNVNVLYAYIIQGERELTTPSLYMTMRLQTQVGCFVMNTVVCITPLKICASQVQDVQRQVKSSL